MSKTLVDKVAVHAAATPGKPAVIAGGRPVSYEELWHRITGAGAFLRRIGVRPGDRVVLSAAASTPSFLYGYLATHLVGGIAVPIDPQTPEARIAYIIRRVDPRAVFMAERSTESTVPMRP